MRAVVQLRRNPVRALPQERTLLPGRHLQPLIDSMIALRKISGAGSIFLFMPASAGAGTPDVIRMAAMRLAKQTGEDVLIVGLPASAWMSWKNTTGTLLSLETAPGVYSTLSDHQVDGLSPYDQDRVYLTPNESAFGFVLADCTAAPGEVISRQIVGSVQGCFIVAAAGETTRAQMDSAILALRRAGTEPTGIVLNKRTYPIPKAIFRCL